MGFLRFGASVGLLNEFDPSEKRPKKTDRAVKVRESLTALSGGNELVGWAKTTLPNRLGPDVPIPQGTGAAIRILLCGFGS